MLLNYGKLNDIPYFVSWPFISPIPALDVLEITRCIVLKRRIVLFGLAELSLPSIASSCAGGSSDPQAETNQEGSPSPTNTGAQEASVVRIGYQRFTDLDLIQIRGLLDQQLQKQNARVEWSFFQSGLPMLEAMNAGSLDFGGVGDAPPIFAQAAGAQFYYVGVTLHQACFGLQPPIMITTTQTL